MCFRAELFEEKDGRWSALIEVSAGVRYVWGFSREEAMACVAGSGVSLVCGG